MTSTLHDGDEVQVVNLDRPVAHGDIVLVEEARGTAERQLIKRVVALGGETVSMVHCTLVLDGVPVEEPYLDGDVVSPGNCGGDLTATTIPDGAVFVLGDNRGGSLDSRNLGPIALGQISGVVTSVRTIDSGWAPVGQ